MKYIKDESVLMNSKNLNLLRDFIIENQESVFSKENEADSWNDFCVFPTSKTDREHLCMPGEAMLIDRNVDNEHFYCVCTFSKSGKILSETPVVLVSDLKSGVWRNGYFLIPNFLTL